MLAAGEKPQEAKDKEIHPTVIDYDLDGYDYRDFWKGRDYEQWAETRVLRHLLDRVGRVQWLVDLGGGFGRNAVHYRQQTDHAVIVDYSLGNLERAAASPLAGEIENGRIFLVRADLYHLPFVDSAFDVGLSVRVLHHLTELDEALAEMGRIVGQRWIVDVPIKHHLLARVRGLFNGETRQLSSWEPKSLSAADTMPFVNFHLAAVRRTLAHYGWDTQLAASNNNFRRWNHVLPARANAVLQPMVYGLEAVAQTVGRGWWGPSQFLWATRRRPATARTTNVVTTLGTTPWATLATKMICPGCHAMLLWSSDAATCSECSRTYPRRGLIWDFVPV